MSPAISRRIRIGVTTTAALGVATLAFAQTTCGFR
jgi:hypothetical protein